MRKWLFRGDTYRQADLYGSLGRADRTTLGQLRQFVAKLEGWPDNAKVKTSNGLVIEVTHWMSADPFVIEEPKSSERDS